MILTLLEVFHSLESHSVRDHLVSILFLLIAHPQPNYQRLLALSLEKKLVCFDLEEKMRELLLKIHSDNVKPFAFIRVPFFTTAFVLKFGVHFFFETDAVLLRTVGGRLHVQSHGGRGPKFARKAGLHRYGLANSQSSHHAAGEVAWAIQGSPPHAHRA
jgi:hypothetical protein